MTGETMTLAVFQALVDQQARDFDLKEHERHLDLQIALSHNMRRKHRVINAMRQLHDHRTGKGPEPSLRLSECINPCESAERTNLHYLFKALKSAPPWEQPKEMLVEPFALTKNLLDLADNLFPCPKVSELRNELTRLVNRILLPKNRREWSEAERAAEIEKYRSDMDDFEKNFSALYTALSIHFKGIEDPSKDPDRETAQETLKNVRKVARVVCAREPSASLAAQDFCLEIWNKYKSHPVIKSNCCVRHHRITFADVFDFCRHKVTKHDITTVKRFAKAVKAAQKRHLRNDTDENCPR